MALKEFSNLKKWSFFPESPHIQKSKLKNKTTAATTPAPKSVVALSLLLYAINDFWSFDSLFSNELIKLSSLSNFLLIYPNFDPTGKSLLPVATAIVGLKILVAFIRFSYLI